MLSVESSPSLNDDNKIDFDADFIAAPSRGAFVDACGMLDKTEFAAL